MVVLNTYLYTKLTLDYDSIFNQQLLFYLFVISY